MATTKIILKKNKANKNGEFPLYLRIIKDRKAKFISLGITLPPHQWNEKTGRVRKSHPNSQRMNNFIAKKISDAEGIALVMETSSKFVPSKKIKQAILGRTPESFIPYAEKYVADLLRSGKMGTYDKANAVISKLKTYIDDQAFSFDDITVEFLKQYEEYLQTKLHNKTNTIHSNLKVIRRIINAAVQDDTFPFEKNPFLRYKLKWENTEKAFLTEEELKKVEDMKLKAGSMKYHHRNIYVFAAYAGGLRISDIFQLKWENINDDHLLLSTQKTNSVVSIKLPKKAQEILNIYKTEDNKPSDYVFPFLKNDRDYSDPKYLFQCISSLTSYTNSDLKDIADDLEFNHNMHFHTSRHTWATRALRKGMRIEYVSKLMGHTSIKTTQVYAKIVNEELDKAMDVFDIEPVIPKKPKK